VTFPALDLEKTGSGRRFMRALLGNRKATVGALILLLICFVAVFPGLIAPDNPQAVIYTPNAGPSSAHLLGTTQLGQDVFSQLIWSTRQTLWVTLLVTTIATFISMLVGVTSAYLGGIVDRVLTVLTDVFLIIPVLPLLILLAAYLAPGVTSLIIVLCVTSWAFQARQLRSQGLSIRNRDFLVAARARGERAIYIILVEIVPTMTSLLAASFLALAVYIVGFAASLQFLGLGNSSELMWGTMLQRAAGRRARGRQRPVGAGPGRSGGPAGHRVRAAQLRVRRDREPRAASSAQAAAECPEDGCRAVEKA